MAIAVIDEVKKSDASTDVNDSIEDVNDFLVTASAAPLVGCLGEACTCYSCNFSSSRALVFHGG